MISKYLHHFLFLILEHVDAAIIQQHSRITLSAEGNLSVSQNLLIVFVNLDRSLLRDQTFNMVHILIIEERKSNNKDQSYDAHMSSICAVSGVLQHSVS